MHRFPKHPMEPVNHRRPHRAIIRCKAKMQLLQTVNDCSDWFEENDILLKELAATLFYSARYQALYERCESQTDTNNTDEILIKELVQTYHHVAQRQLNPVIQRLNALL